MGEHPIVVTTTQKIALETRTVADFGHRCSVGGDLANPPLYHDQTELYMLCGYSKLMTEYRFILTEPRVLSMDDMAIEFDHLTQKGTI